MSATPITPQIVSANQLRSGAVVYLGDAGWTEIIGEARVLADPAAANDLLALAEADARAAKVVAPYLVAVEAAVDIVVPLSLRERLRARGPSVRAGAA